MVAQNGKDLLIKIDVNKSGNFITLVGLRATRISMNAQPVDVTSIESEGGWRQLLAGGGVRSATVSGSGVFRDENTDSRARTIFFDAETPDFQIIIPSFGTIMGAFQITSLEYAGQYEGEATYELSLSSAGILSFTTAT